MGSSKKSFVAVSAAVCSIVPGCSVTCIWDHLLARHPRRAPACSIHQNLKLVIFASEPPSSRPDHWQLMNPPSYVENDGSSHKNTTLNETERERDRQRDEGRASSRFHRPRMMNQFSNVRWQFLTTADWAGSFWKASAITANTPLDSHKKSWQHLSVCWHSREPRAPHLLPLMSTTKAALIYTGCLL